MAITWTITVGGLITSHTGEVPLLFPAPPEFLPATTASEVVLWGSQVALTVLCLLQLRVAAQFWSLRRGPWH